MSQNTEAQMKRSPKPSHSAFTINKECCKTESAESYPNKRYYIASKISELGQGRLSP